jgi:hypothetical protein
MLRAVESVEAFLDRVFLVHGFPLKIVADF